MKSLRAPENIPNGVVVGFIQTQFNIIFVARFSSIKTMLYSKHITINHVEAINVATRVHFMSQSQSPDGSRHVTGDVTVLERVLDRLVCFPGFIKNCGPTRWGTHCQLDDLEA